MINRYPCQVAVLFILGILASKGAAVYREAGAESYGLFLAVLSAAAAAGTAAACMRMESLRKKKLRQAAVLLIAFGSGMLRMHTAAAVMEGRLEGLFNGQEVTMQGRVVKKQPQKTQNQDILWTVYCTDSYLKTSQGIRSCGDMIVYADLESGEPVIGNTIILSGKIKLFNEARNDGNFDERRYYQNQGYTCKIYGGKEPLRIVDNDVDEVREFLYGLQHKFALVYERSMPQEEAGAISAMLLGEKSMLQSGTKQLYQKSGIAHILAISGLHISILGAAVFKLLRSRGVTYQMAASMSMGLLALFACMVGMGLSTMRAVIMFGIYLGAACCGRAYDSVNGLAAAAVCILLKNPAYLFLAGFQFSFLAVAGVLLGKEICQVFRPKYRLAEAVLASLSIQMLTLPLTAWYYFEVPVYSVLLNLLVLPLMGMVLLLGLFGGAAGLLAAGGWVSEGLLAVCTLVLGYFSRIGEFFLRLPGAVCVIGRPKIWQMAGYYAILALCAAFIGKMRQMRAVSEKDRNCQMGAVSGKDRNCQMGAVSGKDRNYQMGAVLEKDTNCQMGAVSEKDANCHMAAVSRRCRMAAGLGFAACLGLLWIRLPKQAEVVVLDVGQGDGIYIRTSDGMDVMIDGGSTDVKQVGDYRILPFLKSQGTAGIDCWFLSHLDQDHISGFQEIIESGYPVGEVVLSEGIVKDEAYEKLVHQLLDARVKLRYMENGDVLRGENACFRCLTPSDSKPADDRNAKSMVLLYEDRGFLGFFSGDISKEEEQKILAENDLGQVALYKAAHHGSKYSNKEELLARLGPDISVVSCAKDNGYGHPGKEAVENMEKYSKTIAYTMHSGQIRIQARKGSTVVWHGFIQ